LIMKKKIFDIIYILTIVIILLAILYIVILEITNKTDILSIFDMLFIIMFYLFGWNLGILFLFLNGFGFFFYREYRYFPLFIFSLIWIVISVFLSFTHGFVI